MATRAPFVNTKFSGYYHRDVPQENEELTHIGPGTPCGEYLRRFWQPMAYSDELTDLPKKLRILGEDLVVYRDFNGDVGLLELHCAHRGTSLEFGIVCQTGIMCCYHGWRFDKDGTILETPGEPASSTLKDRLFQGAYPVHESNGLIFAYMGADLDHVGAQVGEDLPAKQSLVTGQVQDPVGAKQETASGIF